MAIATTAALAYAPTRPAAARQPPAPRLPIHQQKAIARTANVDNESTPGWLRIVIVSRPTSAQKAVLRKLSRPYAPIATPSEHSAKNSPKMLGVMPHEKIITDIGMVK